MITKKRLRSITTYPVLLLLILATLALGDIKTKKVASLFVQWDKSDSPGCALAVIKDGQIIYKRGYGMANLEHNIAISPKSAFYIGSVSKQFVTMCIAILAKRGKLSLDDDIRKYVPEMPDYGIPITIRHLIYHTSGYRDYLELLNIAGVDFGSYHQEDVLELIARQKELNFKPGEMHLYSNSGYFLLAIIIERASGKTLQEFAEINIFKPLGMKNSHFHDDYTMVIKNRASGYYPAGKGKYKNFISTFDCVGSGGLFTSVEDLFLWDQNFYHAKVGGKDLIDLMHKRGTLYNGKELNYAFALKIDQYKGLSTISHGGSLGGYKSAIIRFPEQNFTVICLANLSTFNPTKLCLRVADIYLSGQYKEKKTDREAKPTERAKFIKLPEIKLKEKIGHYICPETGEIIRLFIKNGNLIARESGQDYELGAINETEFQVLDVPRRVIIKFERQAKEEPLVMHIYPEEEKPITYKSLKIVEPTSGELEQYVGDYYNEEIQVTFKIIIKDGKLYFAHRNAPTQPLQPTIQDRFSVRGFKIHFIRDKDDKIMAFTLDSRRVKNLSFDKITS